MYKICWPEAQIRLTLSLLFKTYVYQLVLFWKAILQISSVGIWSRKTSYVYKQIADNEIYVEINTLKQARITDGALNFL